ncbi:glycosyl transferase family 1 [Opitutaceae bacterium EW11]|nr:glycosyl transferase family 1 [Opitutaceae bacterium EW11]
MKLLFSHPTGNANVRHAALGLERAALLGEFWTCINYRGGMWDRVLPGGAASQLRRRAFPSQLQDRLHAYPWREFGRLFAHRVGLGRLARHEHGVLSVDAVYRSLDRRVARRLRRSDFDGVYAYEDGAAFTFAEARQRGMKALYDLPIGYWRAARDILVEEAQREPAWASTLIGNEDSPEKTARKDEELALADAVFVASSFTLKTLASAPSLRAPVHVIPYGAPPRPADAPKRDARRRDGPLRAIFVGSLGQRKGLTYLFEACRKLGRGVELTVIGTLPLEPCPALEAELKRVRWIPSCPHAQVLAEMAAHDVFVFPSLFEGFGLVLLEAMAMGLPIVTTPNTAGPDLITDGKEGFIVPIRSSETLAQKLDTLAADPALVCGMGEAAMVQAATFTWEGYGSRLAACVSQACQPPLPTS